MTAPLDSHNSPETVPEGCTATDRAVPACRAKIAAAALYRAAYKIHHKLFLKPAVHAKHAHVIVVGSFLAGGAGKTPFCAWLAEQLRGEAVGESARHNSTQHEPPPFDSARPCLDKLEATPAAQFYQARFNQSFQAPHNHAQFNQARSNQARLNQPELASPNQASPNQARFNQTQNGTPHIAILCHGAAWDEVRMLRDKLPFASVFACSDRSRTIAEIDSDFDFVICDDGFEDSRIACATVLRLDWGGPPSSLRVIIPAGRCRSLPADHGEPALALRCAQGRAGKENVDIPADANAERSEREICSDANAERDVDVAFSIGTIRNPDGKAFDRESLPPPTLLCGIANSHRFLDDIKRAGISPMRTVFRPDHDRNFEQTLARLLRDGAPVIVTEKDFAKLGTTTRKSPLVYVAFQTVSVTDTARARILELCTQKMC